ncbi:MAG: GIY-YIG nuclease family protein [Bacteroidota bacterium]
MYALYSVKHDRIYIGATSNIKSRLKSHYYYSTKGYTSKFRPWKLVYLEKCSSKKETYIREKQLNSARGRLFIKNIFSIKYM